MTHHNSENPKFTDEEAADRLAFADGILGMAGREVTDPYLNEVAARFACGEISIEEAGKLGDEYIRSARFRASKSDSEHSISGGVHEMNRGLDQSVKTTDEEAADRLAFADGILGMAGREVTDPYLNELALRQSRGEITADESIELAKSHILNSH